MKRTERAAMAFDKLLALSDDELPERVRLAWQTLFEERLPEVEWRGEFK